MRQLIGLLVRIFFRRIALTGTDRVPQTGPVLFVLNHPNSLVDPLFLLAFAPRRVVFLAKEPLFRLPIVGGLMRATGSIPVYRRQDAADMSQNRRTFELVWQELLPGGAVALFPEGTSHSDPQMRPFKTGAARMALGAAAMSHGIAISIVPAGLYYTAKARFRSSALVTFGDPLLVEPAPLGPDGEPAADRVHALTARLEHALAGVTVQADQDAAIRLAARAERVFSSVSGSPASESELADQFALRQRFLRGYTLLRTQAPEKLQQVTSLLAQYDAELSEAGLAPESLVPARLAVSGVAGYTAKGLGFLLVLAPLAIIGVVIHAPAYFIIGPLITCALKVQQDVVATGKMIAAALMFPLTWLAVASVAWRSWGAITGIAALILAPVSGYVALVFFERSDRFIGAARGFFLRLLRPRAYLRLERHRRKIRQAILALDALIAELQESLVADVQMVE